MSTSETTVSPQLAVAREAVVIAVVVTGLTAALARRGLNTGVAPHVAWVVVLLLSARHGGRGFGFGLFAGWGTLVLTGLGLGIDVVPLLVAVSNSTPDLIALAVCMLVAAIASTRERRVAQLTTRTQELAKKGEEDGATIAALQEAAVSLRARADRLDHCLTFLRDVAARLEGGDPATAAQAALDLALARTGAEAGAVFVLEGGRATTFAVLGSWSGHGVPPSEGVIDRTIQAAFESGAPTRACDVPGAGSGECEVATPIIDESGRVAGVLALRGVPADSLRQALVHDLGLIAQWCAKAMRHHVVDVSAARLDAEQRDDVSTSGDDNEHEDRTQSVN
jgi:hypothetical protein